MKIISVGITDSLYSEVPYQNFSRFLKIKVFLCNILHENCILPSFYWYCQESGNMKHKDKDKCSGHDIFSHPHIFMQSCISCQNLPAKTPLPTIPSPTSPTMYPGNPRSSLNLRNIFSDLVAVTQLSKFTSLFFNQTAGA